MASFPNTGAVMMDDGKRVAKVQKAQRVDDVFRCFCRPAPEHLPFPATPLPHLISQSPPSHPHLARSRWRSLPNWTKTSTAHAIERRFPPMTSGFARAAGGLAALGALGPAVLHTQHHDCSSPAVQTRSSRFSVRPVPAALGMRVVGTADDSFCDGQHFGCCTRQDPEAATTTRSWHGKTLLCLKTSRRRRGSPALASRSACPSWTLPVGPLACKDPCPPCNTLACLKTGTDVRLHA